MSGECTMSDIAPAILTLRGQNVILDADLARIYGVTTKALNQAVKRNAGRFPPDFVFRLSPQEVAEQQTAPSPYVGGRMRSQIVTASVRRNLRFPPSAFTEHGALMAATVLNSPRAVEMSVFVVRAFVKMREQLLNRAELEKRLAQIEKGLLAHDAALRDLYRQIRPLLLPPPEPPRKPIGFHLKERRAPYRTKKTP